MRLPKCIGNVRQEQGEGRDRAAPAAPPDVAAGAGSNGLAPRDLRPTSRWRFDSISLLRHNSMGTGRQSIWCAGTRHTARRCISTLYASALIHAAGRRQPPTVWTRKIQDLRSLDLDTSIAPGAFTPPRRRQCRVETRGGGMRGIEDVQNHVETVVDGHATIVHSSECSSASAISNSASRGQTQFHASPRSGT